MRMIVSLLAASALLAPIGAASAKTEPATWVRRILLELDSLYRKQGWVPQGEIRPGSLATGKEARIDFPLAAAAYRFVVICEPGCGAGEVELLDSAGTRVAGPGVLVEMPKLDLAPAAGATYTLRVAMSDCAEASCAWSARLYARR
ncbi:MAG TPA: hypothetical protein VF759_13130 [Allosphingosinicella sp.]